MAFLFAPLRLCVKQILAKAQRKRDPISERDHWSKPMFLGLRTATYRVGDIDKGKAWYSDVLGIEAYFDQPFYVGFNVGGYELGLQPGGDTGGDKADGAVAYWGVPDAATTFARLLELGATAHEPIQDVGEGIKVAAVKDPFGNIFGIIENPHFKMA
jgi:predicted enzyme related to lactoylglutathione lyase